MIELVLRVIYKFRINDELKDFEVEKFSNEWNFAKIRRD